MNDFVSQGALSMLAKIRPGSIEELRGILKDLDQTFENNEKAIFPFRDIRSIHFARFVIVDKSFTEEATFRNLNEPFLMFSTNYDGSENDHLHEIVEVASDGMDQIFFHCYEYPNSPSKKDRFRFLKKIRATYGAFHVGAQGMSVARIQKEGKLREFIQDFIDQNSNTKGWSDVNDPQLIREDIKDQVRSSSEFNWSIESPDRVPIGWKLFRRTGWKSGIEMIVRLPLALVFWLMIRRKEKTDKIYPYTRYDQRAKDHTAREDKVVQNEMSLLVDIKKGFRRRFLLKTVFAGIETLARYVFTKGELGGIPTIHFARWVIVDEGRALMFMSNYGSSWESYLGDFIDKASKGLTGVWSNTVLYPRTRWLLWGGSKDEERFKCWARAQQVTTDVWYTAYSNLTVKNIIQNKQIREGLAAGRMSKQEATEWLKLF